MPRRRPPIVMRWPPIPLRLRLYAKPLPRWVRFDERRRAFVGTVPVDIEIDELRIAVIASDVDGLEARTTFVVRRFVMG